MSTKKPWFKSVAECVAEEAERIAKRERERKRKLGIAACAALSEVAAKECCE